RVGVSRPHGRVDQALIVACHLCRPAPHHLDPLRAGTEFRNAPSLRRTSSKESKPSATKSAEKRRQSRPYCSRSKATRGCFVWFVGAAPTDNRNGRRGGPLLIRGPNRTDRWTACTTPRPEQRLPR